MSSWSNVKDGECIDGKLWKLNNAGVLRLLMLSEKSLGGFVITDT